MSALWRCFHFKQFQSRKWRKSCRVLVDLEVLNKWHNKPIRSKPTAYAQKDGRIEKNSPGIALNIHDTEDCKFIDFKI